MRALPPRSPALPGFGLRLRQMRRATGLKQLALADALNVDQATVSRWERGQQTPDPALQARALDVTSAHRRDDSALHRLVTQASGCVHLVEEATHVCLAYSTARAKDWRVSPRAMLGQSLWAYATDEIRQAEQELAQTGWWSDIAPAARSFCTKGADHNAIRISAGLIRWERLYLNDGTPVRLVSGG